MTRLMTIPTRRRGRYSLAALMMLAALGSAERRAGAGYSYIELGTLGTSPNLFGTGINSSGAVAGYTNNVGFLAAGANAGPVASIGTLPGGSVSYASGINNAGVVVGYSSTGSGSYDAFTYSGGTMTDVTATQHVTLNNSSYNFATAINNSGEIAGQAITGGGTHAFLYNGTSTSDLGTLAGGTSSYATALNDSGQVVGYGGTASGNHAFLYSGGAMHDLGVLTGGSSSYAYDVNASGEVVGNSIISGVAHAFLDNGTTMSDLTAGTAYAGDASFAYGINTSGATVGLYSVGSSNYGFLYSNGTFTDLSNVLAGWTITGAFGINDNGQIAATGIYNGSGPTYALLLTPALLVPEPPTIALLCSGAVVGLGLRRLSRRIKAEDLAADPDPE